MINLLDSGATLANKPDDWAILIPIFAIVLGLSSVMLGMALDFFKKRSMFQLHHQERMAAIEKGIDVPPLPPEFFQSSDSWRRGRRQVQSPADHLYRGVRWLLIGAVAAVGMYLQPNRHVSDNAWIGLVLVALGVSHLIFYAMEGRKQAEALAEVTGPESQSD